MFCKLCLFIVSQQRVTTDSAYVNVLTRGDLSSLQWIESPLKYFSAADHPHKCECHVHCAALNFRDVMLATGKLPPDAIPGIRLIESDVNFIRYDSMR